MIKQEINLCVCRMCNAKPKLSLKDLRKYVIAIECVDCGTYVVSTGINMNDAILEPLVNVINRWNAFNA